MARKNFVGRGAGFWNGVVAAWDLAKAAFLLFIVGGFLYLFSGGGSHQPSPATSRYEAPTVASGVTKPEPEMKRVETPTEASNAEEPDGIRCLSEGGEKLVTLKAGALTAAINGAARSQAAERHWLDGRAMFEPARLNQLLIQGLALCGTDRVEAPVGELTVADRPTGNVASSDQPLTAKALMKAVNDGDMAFVKRWIAAGKSLNAHDSNGGTVVDAAAASGHCDILDVLLKHGGVADPKGVRVGFTPLAHAAWGGHPQCVALLLKKKVRVDVRVGKGDSTPLIIAAYQGNAEVVKLLVDAGASLTITNNDGDTAYRAARYFSNHAAAAYIQSKGGR